MPFGEHGQKTLRDIELFAQSPRKVISGNGYGWRKPSLAESFLVLSLNGGKGKAKTPKLWLETYENAKYEVINRDNYLDF